MHIFFLSFSTMANFHHHQHRLHHISIHNYKKYLSPQLEKKIHHYWWFVVTKGVIESVLKNWISQANGCGEKLDNTLHFTTIRTSNHGEISVSPFFTTIQTSNYGEISVSQLFTTFGSSNNGKKSIGLTFHLCQMHWLTTLINSITI